MVIVTGASSGIGRETAIAFAKRGARVVLAARNESRLRDLVASYPGGPDPFLIAPTDVTDDGHVARLVDATMARWGRIDILVNNAGMGLRSSVAATQPEDARLVFEVNFFGPLRCIVAVLPHLQKQGSGQIVNVGSVLSLIATPNNSIYSASKFALRALSDALRLEVKTDGIDVISILPGYTDTPFFDNLIRYDTPARVTSIRGQHPATVANAIVRACQRRQREVVLSLPGKMGALLKRFAPRILEFALARTCHNP